VTLTTGLGLVATTCPSCGKVRVAFNGWTVKVVDLVSPSRVDNVFIPLWLGNEDEGDLDEAISGVVTIRVISSGKPVTIDALAVAQPWWVGSPF
jgi:hypothetical protein